jgi:hypothetical protein
MVHSKMVWGELWQCAMVALSERFPVAAVVAAALPGPASALCSVRTAALGRRGGGGNTAHRRARTVRISALSLPSPSFPSFPFWRQRGNGHSGAVSFCRSPPLGSARFGSVALLAAACSIAPLVDCCCCCYRSCCSFPLHCRAPVWSLPRPLVPLSDLPWLLN